MVIQEYGTEHKETILLLHGDGLSWWNYRDAAELLQDEYHVILPILDGNAGSDRSFTSIEENASDRRSKAFDTVCRENDAIGKVCEEINAVALPDTPTLQFISTYNSNYEY